MSISRVQSYPTCCSELHPTCRSVERIFVSTFRPGNFIGPRKIAGHVPARGCPPTTIFITHRPCLITSHPPPSSKSEADIDINNVMPTAPQADPPPPAAAGGAAPAASTTTTDVSSSTQQPLASTLPPLPPPVGGAGAERTELVQGPGLVTVR